MPIYTKLLAPSFDLDWLMVPPDTRGALLIPGGGGASKTGVKNVLQVAKPTDTGVFEFLDGYDTGSKLCTSVSSGLVEKADGNIPVVCLGFDDGFCTLLEVIRAEDNSNVCFRELIAFQADFSEKFSSVNCSHIFSNGSILTGGEDGTCRLWRLSHNNNSWTASKDSDICAQQGSVTSINVHPFKPLVCISSKDGTVNVFNLDSGVVVGRASSASGNRSILLYFTLPFHTCHLSCILKEYLVLHCSQRKSNVGAHASHQMGRISYLFNVRGEDPHILCAGS